MGLRSLNKAVEWKRDSNLTYPNVTVCFAKFFDKKRMEGEPLISLGPML
jgi:hypothetical protein